MRNNRNKILTVSNLSVTLEGQKILRNLCFEVYNDDIIAIIGPNGAGKTVLFRTLLGLLPYTGSILWSSDFRFGYVPQKINIEKDLPLTTLEFLQFREKNFKEIKKVLSEVGFSEDTPHRGHLIEHVLKQKIGVLSGGELQRIMIAYAILGHPEILFFDEPTEGIDIGATESVYELLRKLKEKENLTIFLISHELQVVYKYASKVICLNKENICFGSPTVVLSQKILNKLFGGEIGIYQHPRKHY